MGGYTYEALMNTYENAVSECPEGDEDCRKNRVISLLESEFGQSFISFKSNFNAFQSQTSSEVDYVTLVQRYNELYNQMNTDQENLENEIEALDTLIRNQSGETQNYNNIIDERNTEIHNTTSDIENKNNEIDTVNEDINNLKKGKEIIRFLGIIPISNVPLEINYVKILYQLLSIFFLFLFILIIKLIKDSPETNIIEL